MKFRRSNSGIFYLIAIVLAAAVAGGAFRMDDGVLLIPVVLLTAVIIGAMVYRNLRKSK